MRLTSLFISCLLLSACSFGYLTEIANQDHVAPTAGDCGGCHVEQYAEWQQTSHAQAYISTEFKQQSDHYADQDCLFCHVPGDVHDPEREPRRYNREEGVTCVSCHLHDGAMQGPHESGALISPHAIAKNDTVNSKIDSPKLCGTCHHDTYGEWLDQQEIAQTPYPTCHACHGAPVKRSHTQGTNLFSDLLLALEPEHEVRSHHLMLPGQINPEAAPQIQLVENQGDEIIFRLSNTLPHALPTGSFGEKYIMLTVNRLDGNTILATNSMSLPSVLIAGQSILLSLSLPQEEQDHTVQINLKRFHQSTGAITLIRSYHFPEETHVQSY